MTSNIANAIPGRECKTVDRSLSSVLGNWRKKVGCGSLLAALPVMPGPETPEALAKYVGAATTPSAGRDADLIAKRDLRRGNSLGFYRRAADYRLPHQRDAVDLVNAFTGSDDCPGTALPAGDYTAGAPYVDTGDTTGANDTVTKIVPYYAYDSRGPDRIYTFVVTSIGENPGIRVTTTSPTYRPMIYVSNRPCPAGTGATISDWVDFRWYSIKAADSRWGTGNEAVIEGYSNWNYADALYFGKRLYLFIDSNVAGDAGPYTLTINDMRIASKPTVERHARPDFDGDGLSDFAVFRPSDSTWYIRGSTEGPSAVRWGLPTDKLVPEDYDGDGKTDPAVFRDGVWYLLNSSEGPTGVQWGLPGDIPVAADYTGDGRSEIAVFRDGAWWILDLKTNTFYLINWGLAGDKPVPMDYDADGKVDQAVVRDGIWYLNQSRLGIAGVRWGLGSDKIVPGYYGPHNQADFSVYRDGAWFTRIPTFYWNVPNGVLSMQWGFPTDIPVTGHFFSVGPANAGVFREGVWLMKNCVGLCSGGYGIQWGQAGDIPISGVYNR